GPEVGLDQSVLQRLAPVGARRGASRQERRHLAEQTIPRALQPVHEALETAGRLRGHLGHEPLRAPLLVERSCFAFSASGPVGDSSSTFLNWALARAGLPIFW